MNYPTIFRCDITRLGNVVLQDAIHHRALYDLSGLGCLRKVPRLETSQGLKQALPLVQWNIAVIYFVNAIVGGLGQW